ncbi:unnamed protein product [Pedinophyceae sp. YPF-701]|nr:unnamed protein product [Pedinophyceae sp. YPF-701]
MVWPFGGRRKAASTTADSGAKAISAADEGLHEEAWSDGKQEVKVYQPEGLMCLVQVRARVPLSPQEIFDILTSDTNQEVFRNMVGIKSRKILEDDGRGRMKLQLEQEGRWRFLMFRGKFPVNLLVEQDRNKGFIKFRLLKTGFMKVFEGEWELKHYTHHNVELARQKDTVQAAASGKRRKGAPVAAAPGKDSQHKFGMPSLDLSGLPGFLRPAAAKRDTLVTLRQSLKPAVTPPPPLDSYVRRISAKVTREVIEDLQKEAERRRKKERAAKAQTAAKSA